jgi:hypothetical protein
MLNTNRPFLLSTFNLVPDLSFNFLRNVAGMVIRPRVVNRLGLNGFLHYILSALTQFTSLLGSGGWKATTAFC